MILNVRIPDIEKIRKRLKGMSGEAEAVMSRALNKTVRHVQSQIVQEAKKPYIVKTAAVKKTLTVHWAKKNSLSAEVRSQANKKIPLYGFKVTPKTPMPSSPPAFFQSQVIKNSGLKALFGSNDRSAAFVARVGNGHVGIFQRKLGVQRAHGPRENRPWWANRAMDEQIVELFGPSIPTIIGSLKVAKAVQVDAHSFLQSVLASEIRRITEANV